MVKKKSCTVKLFNSKLKSLGQYRSMFWNYFAIKSWLSLFVTLYLAALALQIILCKTCRSPPWQTRGSIAKGNIWVAPNSSLASFSKELHN